MIHVVTLPSIDTRYTAQWYKWLLSWRRDNERRDIAIYGDDKEYVIPPTEFLDYRQYYMYVLPQLRKIVESLHSGDTIFFMDGETGGVEIFEYIRKMSKLDITINTFWHSGTYDKYDLTAKRGVQGEYFEKGWFNITDKIFVSSEYHKQLLRLKRDVPLSKIEVTGNPLDLRAFEDGTQTEKKYEIIFAGRKVKEKGYDIVQHLIKKEKLPIVCSLDMGWNKKQFYHALAQSKVLFSPAQQDMFATAVMEAFGSNIPVLVPNTPQYRAIVPERYIYDDWKYIDWSSIEDLGTGEERKLVEKYDYNKVFERWFN